MDHVKELFSVPGVQFVTYNITTGSITITDTQFNNYRLENKDIKKIISLKTRAIPYLKAKQKTKG